MPSFNINQLFARKKSCTEPVYKIPSNTREWLGIDTVQKNGIFKIEPMKGVAMYDRCYIFEDVNYINKDIDKKKSTLLELIKLFKCMDSQFKITIASEQHDMKSFFREVFSPMNGEEYPLLEDGIGTWINQKIEEGTRDIRKLLLLTVTHRAKSFVEAETFFGTLDTTLTSIFYGLKSQIYRMSAVERLKVIQRMARAGESGIPVSNQMIEKDTDDWKNQIVPAFIDATDDYMKINDRYTCVLFAHDYDQSLNEEKVLHALTDVTFPVYITLDMEPIRKRLLKDRLLAAHTNNEKNMSSERESLNNKGQYTADNSYTLKKKKEELENLMDQVDGNDEEALFLGLLVMVSADSPEVLEQRADTLMQIATSNGYTLDPYYHRQIRAFNTVLPIGGRQVNQMRPIITSSAVAFQPFYAKDMQSGKYIYGLNKTTKQLLRGDRKDLPAPHGIMVGHTGSGKSMLIKITEISQTLLLTNDDVIAIDPNNEQKDYIESLHGQFFDFTPQCQVFLNPFEVPEYVAAGNDVDKNMFIAKKTEYAISFCTAIMTNIVVTQVHMNYISRAVRKMYEDYFNLHTSWSKHKNQPTLCKLRELLKQEVEKSEYREDRRILLDIVDSMENFTDGPYDMFAHPSNLDIDNRLIGFGLKNLPDSVWEPAMLTIMHFLSMRITYNQQTMVALRLIVDEAQYLCARPSTAEQLLHAVETYRKAGAVVTLAVQNLTRVLEHEDLRDMFSNCPYKCFLDLGGIDAANLASIQELSAREYAELENPKPGHGVMCWGGQIFLFDTRMKRDNPLYPLLNTNFHEKAAQAAENKGEDVKVHSHG